MGLGKLLVEEKYRRSGNSHLLKVRADGTDKSGHDRTYAQNYLVYWHRRR